MNGKSGVDPCSQSAVEILAGYAEGTLSPVDVMTSVIERAGRVEPEINAFAFEYFDESMAQAQAAERAWREGRARPLEGIPLAIKDEHQIAGRITTNGSLLLKDNVAASTDIVAQRLLDAGAIIHASTTTPEFSTCFVTASRIWGVTRNPWNPAITPGGSSGGAGAALAAGSTVLANGSDIAGSIRVPAAQCGVVGFKPSHGRVPQSPPWNFDTYCHEGPLARNVPDCILLFNQMSGPHPADIVSLKPKLTLPVQYDGISGWRVGYSMDLGFMEVDADVRRNTETALDVFRDAGARVEQVDPGWGRQCMTTAMIHLTQLMGGMLVRDAGAPEQRERLTPYIRDFLDRWDETPSRNYLAALEYTGKMYATLGPLFEHIDVLVVPTTATTDIAADFDYSRQELTVNGKKVDPLLGWTLTWPFNTLGRCPVLSVPSGLAANGVPTGIQIVGPAYEDARVMQAGMAYEAAAGGPFIRPGRRPAVR